MEDEPQSREALFNKRKPTLPDWIISPDEVLPFPEPKRNEGTQPDTPAENPDEGQTPNEDRPQQFSTPKSVPHSLGAFEDKDKVKKWKSCVQPCVVDAAQGRPMIDIGICCPFALIYHTLILPSRFTHRLLGPNTMR